MSDVKFDLPYEIVHNTYVTNTYEVYLDKTIEKPLFYHKLFSLLDNASETDVFIFKLNTDGGHFDTCIQLQASLETTPAHTIGVIYGDCHSAGSAIFLSCKEHYVQPMATMLVHNASYGIIGRSSEILSEAEFNARQHIKWLEGTYEGFLNKEEIDLIEKGKQHTMNAEEIIERLENRKEYFEKLMEDDSDSEVVFD